MRNHIKHLLSACLATTLSLTSCNDVLDLTPPDQLSAAIFWQSESDADLALTGLYNFLYAGGGGYATSQYQIFAWDNFSDDSYSQHNYGGGTSALSSGITPQSGDFVANYYTNNYQAIAAINSFLANVEKVLTGEKLMRYQSEAYFLRAFNYFWLAQLYGNTIIVTEDPFSLDFKATRAKSDKAEVLQLIEEDLEKAIAGLPDDSYKDGHAVKATAQGYLVRVLLYQEKFAEAATLAESIISGNKHTLYSNYSGNFYKPEQNSSNEIMFSVKYLQPNLLHQDVAVAVSLQRWKGEQGTQDLIDEYEGIDGNPTATSAGFDPSKPFENRDPRMRQTFFFPGDTEEQGWPFTGDLSVATPGKDGWTVGFYPVKKWLTPSLINPDYGAIDDNDFVLLRYADILLMHAEAENEANGPAEALASINMVRIPAGMPNIQAGVSKEQLRDLIRHERRVEFALEGLRYFDLRRWGIAEQKLNGFVQNPLAPTIKSKYEAKYDLWPIPQTEIDRNAPVLEQNPGY